LAVRQDLVLLKALGGLNLSARFWCLRRDARVFVLMRSCYRADELSWRLCCTGTWFPGFVLARRSAYNLGAYQRQRNSLWYCSSHTDRELLHSVVRTSCLETGLNIDSVSRPGRVFCQNILYRPAHSLDKHERPEWHEMEM
jgi:hypothetical protein